MILQFPIHPQSRKIILKRNRKTLVDDLEMLKLNVLNNLASQKLFANLQDSIANIDRELWR